MNDALTEKGNKTPSLSGNFLSAVIITLNEEKNIGRCLSSLAGLADEIVVIDSGSTDQTVEICRKKGAKVVFHPFEGHISQKNFALTQASHELVLSLDADEVLSETLHSSILAIKQHRLHDAYTFNRLNIYCGREIRHGGWYPDRKLRLALRSQVQWTGIDPHDQLSPSARARVAWLEGDLLHYSYDSVESHLRKAVSYAAIGAKARAARGHKATWIKLIISPIAIFFRRYVLQMGFRDGWYGWIISLVSAWETWMKYALLREMGKKQPPL
ncbi:MAG: glycosyltransferase family 2 protein [Bacteroidetes bacterium]|nr:MAG: glycosyltransferase family 2 protein [Bacteroidota bacterium]